MTTEPTTPENIADTDAPETYAAWKVFDATGDVMPLLRQSIKGERERNRLKDWKESAIAIEKSWDAQAVSKELNLPLGSDIRAGILPAIRAIKEENARLRAWLGESKANAQELAKGYDALLDAVVKLRDCKGRHHTQLAANDLFALIPDWVDTDWANRPRTDDRVEKG